MFIFGRMKRLNLLFLILVLPLLSQAQGDWTWWNEINGWEPGMPTWRTFLTISPGYLGPNALPVPEVKKGILSGKKEVEAAGNFHFKEGDPTQDISGRLYYPFADNKIAIEIYGVAFEHYGMTEEVRDERSARDKDGKGVAIGDLYFSTLVQLWKDRKFPDALLRMTGKTASGTRLDAARYADAPGYFFDVSFSKNYTLSDKANLLPFASFGFYSWQTNDDELLQNDALMYSLGFDISKEKWNLSNSLAGYNGYKIEKDSPVVYNLEFKKQLQKDFIKLKFTYGLHDWTYKTITIAYIWQWE